MMVINKLFGDQKEKFEVGASKKELTEEINFIAETAMSIERRE